MLEGVGEPKRAAIPDAVSVAKAAELLSITPVSVRRHCAAGKYPGARKQECSGGEGWLIPVGSLPPSTQTQLAREVMNELAARLENAPALRPHPLTPAPVEYATLWKTYERASASGKRKAQEALGALVAFQELVDTGLAIGEAAKAIQSARGIVGETLWRYRKAVKGHPQQHWLALLVPHYSKEGRPPQELSPGAYDFILADFFIPSQPPLSAVIDRARRLAPEKGWTIPASNAPIARRIKKEPAWLFTLGRDGPKALEHSYPAPDRSYAALRLHEFWESDGRRADVVCLWPDGTRSRPFVIVWREVRSRLVIGIGIYLNPTTQAVLDCLGMALERTRSIPENAKVDNGPEYAGKNVTGGQKSRYRFHIKPAEPIGIFTQMGIIACWSRPGRGQDKPVESWHGFVAQRVDKSAKFQGAYCGRNPVEKPEDFDPKKAVPVIEYAKELCSFVDDFNNRPHRGDGMDGKSPLQVYNELLPLTDIKTPDAAHIRLCKMGHRQIKPDKKDSTLTLIIDGYGERKYWHQTLSELPSTVLARKLNVYHSLNNPNASVSVYDGDLWLCDAEAMDRLPFLEEGGAGAAAHVKAKNAWMKPKRDTLKAIRVAGAIEPPALDPVSSIAPLPQPIGAIPIENRRLPSPEPEKAGPLQPTEKPGEFINPETGKTYQQRIRAIPSATAATDTEGERLAELERLAREKREQTRPESMRTPARKTA
jgi:putative transposase